MSGSRKYRIRAADGLPKTMDWQSWLRTVFEEKPAETTLAGVVGFDRGEGRVAHALVWIQGEARIYSLASEAGTLLPGLSTEDATRLRAWQAADQRGEYAAALSRGTP